MASPGQDIAITQKPTSIALHEEQGENIMILGINDKHYATRTAINMLVSSIATSRAKGLDYEFIILDCMKCEDDEEYMEILDELESRRICKLIKPRERKKTLYDLCKNIASGNPKPTILTILGEETFRELKFDDILDVTADEKELGKPVGSDKESGKSTYVSLLGLDKSQKIVDELTGKAIDALRVFDDTDFLVELTERLASRKN